MKKVIRLPKVSNTRLVHKKKKRIRIATQKISLRFDIVSFEINGLIVITGFVSPHNISDEQKKKKLPKIYDQWMVPMNDLLNDIEPISQWLT